MHWSANDRPSLLAHDTHTWPHALQHRLLALPDSPYLSLSELGQLNTACSITFADAINRFLHQHGYQPDDIAVIGSHGQTVWHQPQGEHPFTLQLGHGALLAKRTGIAVAADFRMDDLAVGGQGAPLAPALHQQLFTSATDTPVGVLNLGGIANLTLLRPSQPPLGFDTGPANTLLDAWYRHHHPHSPYDADGAWAASASPDEALLSDLLTHPYFQQSAPKSTGREDFNLAWLQRHARTHALPPAVVQRTLLALTAHSVAQAWESHCTQVKGNLWVCGGGARNPVLMQALQQHLPQCRLASTDAAGYPADAIEALLFAWLGKLRLEQRPIDLSAITGQQRAVTLGGLWLP